MSYRNTLQADALKLVARKLQSSLAAKGELPEEGLAAYGKDGDDLIMALARKVVSGQKDEPKWPRPIIAAPSSTRRRFCFQPTLVHSS